MLVHDSSRTFGMKGSVVVCGIRGQRQSRTALVSHTHLWRVVISTIRRNLKP